MARPMRTNSPCSDLRIRRRIAERARPVTAMSSQPGSGAGVPERMISTTSPFWMRVRSGRWRPLILAPTQVSPTSVCTA